MRASQFILLSGLLFCGCKDEGTPPPPYVPSIVLEAEDASCTEAWLKVTVTVTPATVALLRDGARVSLSRLQTLDTLLIDEGLLPHHTYTYQLQRLNADSSIAETSASVQLATMDTTSHNFTWQIDTLGVTASTLNDVAIINDTLAYAVGEMYLNDSTGQLDPIPYNMAKWNGVSWQIMRIQFYTICGQSGRTPYPAKSVAAFGANDVWVAMNGDQVARWNGVAQIATMCLPLSFTVNKLWGESANSVYAVGAGGNIMHYASGTWQRVESGTTLPIWDVFGAKDDRSGNFDIICVASNHSFPKGRKLLKIRGFSAIALPDSGLPWSIDELWFLPGRKYVVVGDGLYQVRTLGEFWIRNSTLPPLYKEAIDGQGLNDIVVVGSFWNFVHFNGLSWRSYFTVASGSLGSVSIRGNLVVAVGGVGNRALVIQGRR